MAKIIEFQTGLDWEKVQLADEVAKEEDFSTVVVNASLDGIVTYDLNSRYTLWNPQMEKLTGLTSDQVLGKFAYDLFPFLRDAGIDKLYEGTFRGETGTSSIMRFTVPATGSTGYSQQTNFPLYNEFGEITGGIAVIRDMTSIKSRFDKLISENHVLEKQVRELEQKLNNKNSERPTLHRIFHRILRGLFRSFQTS
jgi:PAS domain S-box-containing protein